MNTTETLHPDQVESQRDALVGRLFNGTLESLELIHVYIGDRLGLYRALAKGPTTTAGLAAEAGVNERYAREWLEQQAVAGIVSVDTSDEPAEMRRYALPPGHAEVLLGADSLAYLAPLARAVVGIAAVMPQVLEAFRSGKGVPYEAYGPDVRGSIAMGNRPMFLNQLATWFSAIPDVDARLRAEPHARVADIGCGTGWSSIAIARAYPLATVHGLDLDNASIEEAKRNADAEGLADRVKFEARDAADPGLAGSFDLVTAFETIHDMSHPVDVLRAMRGLSREGGAVVIADERVAEEFSAPGDQMERFFYGWSAVHCLAVGMVEADAAGTGTVMRPSKLREYAIKAGFKDAEVLPIEHDLWRFYRATI